MPATYFYNMVRCLDTNWIQRRDDVLNLPSLLDFSFERAVQVPLSLFDRSPKTLKNQAFWTFCI